MLLGRLMSLRGNDDFGLDGGRGNDGCNVVISLYRNVVIL